MSERDNERKVTIKEIAKQCGVSITTVSRVINNSAGCCREETRKQILQKIEELNYHPNPIARSLVTKKTNMVAVLLPDINNFFFQEFYKGVEDSLTQYGYILLLCNTNGSIRREIHYLEEMSHGVVDGMIVATLNGREDNRTLLKLAEQHIPLVLAERYGEELRAIPRVMVDNRAAVECAVQTLFEKGHRKIAYIGGPEDSVNACMRYEGFQASCRRLGLELNENLVRYGDYKINSGFKCMQQMMQLEKFTAVIAANDLMAIGACKAVRARHWSVPDQISVIGLDGTLAAEINRPSLTTMEIHGELMGKLCGKNLRRLMEGKNVGKLEVVLKPELREGESIRSI